MTTKKKECIICETNPTGREIWEIHQGEHKTCDGCFIKFARMTYQEIINYQGETRKRKRNQAEMN